MSVVPARRTRTRLGLRSTGLSMTPSEFDAIRRGDCDGRFRYELIRGVLVVSPFAGRAEVDPNQYPGYLLIQYQEGNPLGRIIDATLFEQTIYSTPNRRRCDRAIWVGLGRIPDPEVDLPAIVVEFVSRSRRDQARDCEEKRSEYLAAGVREYWIIDRFRRMMTVHRDHPGAAETIEVAEAATYESPLLPGFALPLKPILARADAWPAKRRSSRNPKRGAD